MKLLIFISTVLVASVSSIHADSQPLIEFVNNTLPNRSALTSRMTMFYSITTGCYFKTGAQDLVVEECGIYGKSKRTIGIYDTNQKLVFIQDFTPNESLTEDGGYYWKNCPKFILKANSSYVLATYTPYSSSHLLLPFKYAIDFDPKPITNLTVESRIYGGGADLDYMTFPGGRWSVDSCLAGGNIKFRPLSTIESVELAEVSSFISRTPPIYRSEENVFSLQPWDFVAYRLQQSSNLSSWTPVGDWVRGVPANDQSITLPDQEGANGFYRLEVTQCYATKDINEQVANLLISDGVNADTEFTYDSTSGLMSGTYESSTITDGVVITIAGNWSWIPDPTTPNEVNFQATLERIRVPYFDFDGTPYEFVDEFEGPIGTESNTLITFTSIGEGTYTKIETLTNGHSDIVSNVAFNINIY